jgi:integrase
MTPSTQTKELQPPIAKFVNRYHRSTGYIYRSGILDFFDFIAGKRLRGFNATDEDLKTYEKLALDYLMEKDRDYSGDLLSYVHRMGEVEVLPKTAHTRIVAVKEFLSFNDIVIDPRTIKDVKRLKPKGGRRTDFEYIDQKTLRELLHHGDARFKAFVLVLASSGIRLGEALNLNWSDIKTPDRTKYPDKPASIFIRTSKTGHSRTTYISRECEMALQEWQKVYSDYLEFATKRSENLKNVDVVKKSGDKKVFPFTRTSVYAMWDSALTKAGYFSRDDQTRRVKMNLHRLRNFFSVQVASASGTQVSELLLGHTDKYGNAYTGRSQEDLEREYLKAEYALTTGAVSSAIEFTQRQVTDLQKQLEETREEMRHLKGRVGLHLVNEAGYTRRGDTFYLNADRLEKLMKKMGIDEVVDDEGEPELFFSEIGLKDEETARKMEDAGLFKKQKK